MFLACLQAVLVRARIWNRPRARARPRARMKRDEAQARIY